MKHTGFSLIEVLTTLAIIAILTTVSVGDFSEQVNRNKVDTQLLSLRQLFAVARQKAIDTNSYITLCPSLDLISCSYLWNQSIIVFSDKNKNAIVDNSDTVWVVSKLYDEKQHVLKQPSNKSYFRFSPLGYTQGTPGNISFCGSNQKKTTARQLILSMAGRTRISSDQDKDGFHEDSNGNPLNCPT